LIIGGLSVVKKNAGKCVACGEPAVIRDMCQVHYDAMRRHGHFDSLRPADWGQRDKHPLYERWKSMFRQGGRSERWMNFWNFVEDVGEGPPDYRLHRLRGEEPWGPNNFEWLPVEARRGSSDREGRNAYMREWHRRNPGRSRSYAMKRQRGITIDQYAQMLESQGGRCAICNEEDPNFRLCIDHDHATGANRGLLCTKCNRGLGLFCDSVDLLMKAALYLEQHKKPEAA
jgi:Recombination endonuclease VII